MRVLSSLRARLALVVLLVAVPAALLIHFFAVRAGEALLARHPGSQPGSGHALLGQEMLGLGLLAAAALAAHLIGGRLLVVRGPGKLLSAGELRFRDTLSALWKFWREAERAVRLSEADKDRQSMPQASAPEAPPP